MRALPALLASVLLTCSTAALAQPASDAPSAPPAPPAAPATVSCTLGEVTGMPAEAARSWLAIVCQEVLRQETAPASYRLHVYRLDRTALLRLTADRGGVTTSEPMQIGSADELPVVAPRLVRAVVQGRPFAETAGVETVSKAESRVPLQKPGKMLFGAGLFGAGFVGADRSTLPAGLTLSLAYETTSFAAVLDLRPVIMGNERDDDTYKMSWTSLSIGGRYFLSDANITPLLGAGMIAAGGTESVDTYSSNGQVGWKRQGSGPGAYAEVGMEALRLHTGRLVIAARLEMPFFRLNGKSGYGVDGTSKKSDGYVMPLTIGATYYFW